MKNKTKQIMLISLASFAIAGLMLSCSSLNQLGVQPKTEAEKSTAFQLSGLSISPAEVAARDEVVISAEVTNVTSVDDTYNAELKINNATEASDKVLVPAGKTQALTFVIFKDAPGTYKVALGELAGQFVVSEPVSEPTKSGCCGSAASGTAATSGCCGATGSSNPVVPVPRRVSGCCGR